MKTLTELQKIVVDWGTISFGSGHMSNPELRALRLVEEAIEFAQSVNANREQLHKLIDYVYSRPVGEPTQELGGVGVTWLAAAHSLNTSANKTLLTEIERVLAKSPEHFKQRNQNKLDAGFGVETVEPPLLLPTKQLGCNRHFDCNAAEAEYLATHGVRPGLNFHCHDDECEDCLGC